MLINFWFQFAITTSHCRGRSPESLSGGDRGSLSVLLNINGLVIYLFRWISLVELLSR